MAPFFLEKRNFTAKFLSTGTKFSDYPIKIKKPLYSQGFSLANSYEEQHIFLCVY